MTMDEVTKCVVRISGSEVTDAALRIDDQDELKNIMISEEMSVRLIDVSGGKDFEITSVSSLKQKIVHGEFSEWVFYVRPLNRRNGIHVLTLIVQAHFDGGVKDLPLIEKSIKVDPGEAMRVVFAAADCTQDLDLEQEARIIKKQLAKGNTQFQYTSILNMDVLQLQELLGLEAPDVLHFSGHGSVEGIMVYGDRKADGPVLANTQKLKTIFELTLKDKKLACLILNACYSATQFAVLQDYCEVGIGTSAQIPNLEAQTFSKYFYSNLYAGRNFSDAYTLSLAAMEIDIDENDATSLYRRFP